MPHSRAPASAVPIRRGRFLWETLWTAGDNPVPAGRFPTGPVRREDAVLLFCGEPTLNHMCSEQGR
jgi:hypothetical protein